MGELDLPQGYLTAGCLFQTIWNARSGRAPDWGIKDYDVFYYDSGDLSWEAEDAVIQRVAQRCADLPVAIEVKNQARVHLWYEQRFGSSYPVLTSACDGIARYLVECTCVGIKADTGALYAPYGFDDLWHGRLRINPAHARPEQFRDKAEAYRARWPWLEICEG